MKYTNSKAKHVSLEPYLGGYVGSARDIGMANRTIEPNSNSTFADTPLGKA